MSSPESSPTPANPPPAPSAIQILLRCGGTEAIVISTMNMNALVLVAALIPVIIIAGIIGMRGGSTA